MAVAIGERAADIDRFLPALRIRWQEAGGPSVQTPQRSGFGRLLLERALRADLDAAVQLDFAPAGLECVIKFPLDRFGPPADSQSATMQ